MFTGAVDLDQRINETLKRHRELQDRVAKVDGKLQERIAKFESDIVRLEGIFNELSHRVVSHLNSVQGESDRFIQNTEIEFEAFRKLLIEVSDEVLRLYNVIERE